MRKDSFCWEEVGYRCYMELHQLVYQFLQYVEIFTIPYYFAASEVRSWLLYYSLPVLKGILPDDFYCHYALLATSIYLLLQQPVTQDALLLAELLRTLLVTKIINYSLSSLLQ